MAKPNLLLIALCLSAATTTRIANAAPPKRSGNVEATVKLYLGGDTKYCPGDLITQSHLADIQAYLRRTQGNVVATHRKWWRLALPDSAPLVQIYYRGGGPVLRKAASKLGGYAGLDRLSRSSAGLKRMQQAIDDNTPAELIQFLTAEQAQSVAEQPDEQKELAATVQLARIYTADDFFVAMKAPPPAQSTSKNRATSAGQQRSD